MTPILHQPWNLEHRRDAPIDGRRRPTPPTTTCDKCGTRLNTYNTHGRCHPCANTHGWPDTHDITATGLLRPYLRRGHTHDCRCFTSRYPATTPAGDIIRTRKGIRYLIPITCPNCGAARAVTASGQHKPLCTRNYQVLCEACNATRTKRQRKDQP